MPRSLFQTLTKKLIEESRLPLKVQYVSAIQSKLGVGLFGVGLDVLGLGLVVLLFFGCFLLRVLEFLPYLVIIEQLCFEMGACMVAANLQSKENNHLPRRSLRNQIAAELQERTVAKNSTKRRLAEQENIEPMDFAQVSFGLKPMSKSQVASQILESHPTLNVFEQNDSGPRAIKQVVITHDITRSMKDLSDAKIRSQVWKEDKSEEQMDMDGEIEDQRSLTQGEVTETPFNRIDNPCGDMIGKGVSQADNRLISLSLASKEPLRLNAIKLKNGSVYSGEWVAGKRHGKGVLLWADGSRYEGQWRDNCSEGQGKLTYSQHESYQGTWHKNCRDGQGKMTGQGRTYEGSWRDDKQEGKGIQRWTNGDYYQGEWCNGVKQGQGRLVFSDGSSYHGQFQGNEIHGFGKYHWHKSRTYEGYWQHNRMQGRGVMTWLSGQRYQGQFHSDKMHGHGIFTNPDGSTAQGPFQAGRRHGHFIETDPECHIKQTDYFLGKRAKQIDDLKNYPQKSSQSKTTSSVTQ